MNCLQQAIKQHQLELLGYLQRRCNDADCAEDLLQEVLLRALAQGDGFCTLQQPRAWLFQVARNLLIDHHRRSRPHSPLPDDLFQDEEESAAVDLLSECLERNLARLCASDRAIVAACDLQGMTVKSFALQQQLTLAAAKARLQRARSRLRQSLVHHCHVELDHQGNVCCYRP